MDLLAYKLVGMLWQKEAALTSVLKDTSKQASFSKRHLSSTNNTHGALRELQD